MNINDLKKYIDEVLGDSVRCLLPSYWWKKIFGEIVDKIDDVEKTSDKKIQKVIEDVSNSSSYKSYVLEYTPNSDIKHPQNGSTIQSLISKVSSKVGEIPPITIAQNFDMLKVYMYSNWYIDIRKNPNTDSNEYVIICIGVCDQYNRMIVDLTFFQDGSVLSAANGS